MEIGVVAELVVLIVIGLLAGEKAWAIFRPPPMQKAIQETNGKLSHLEEEIQKLHRETTSKQLDEIKKWIVDVHEDIVTLRTENTKTHLELVEKLREKR